MKDRIASRLRALKLNFQIAIDEWEMNEESAVSDRERELAQEHMRALEEGRAIAEFVVKSEK